MSDYAIIQHGGKQYRVSPGEELLVERMPSGLAAGDDVAFERVMMISRGDTVQVGQPVVDGAVVRGRVVTSERGAKLLVFKKKRRKGYKRTRGHRQNYYRVRVEAIEA